MRPELHAVAVIERRIVDLLPVDHRAVTALMITNGPPLILLASKNGMDTRAERIGQGDVTVSAAPDKSVARGIKREICSRSLARQNGEIGVHGGVDWALE
jgi:hypothetical protein